MDAVAAAVAALGAADRYAKEILAWQARLDAWEAAFSAWQGDGKLIPPPTPPTTSRWPTTDEVKSAQREAAYNAAGIVRGAAHARWAAMNDPRKKEVKRRGRPDDDGERATKHRQDRPLLANRHRERELQRHEEKKLGPQVVRQFHFQQQVLSQREHKRQTGITVFGAVESDSDSDDGSSGCARGLEVAAEPRPHQDLWQWRATAAGVETISYGQEHSVEAELVAVCRSGVCSELGSRLHAIFALQATCQAARRAVMERMAPARVEFDAAYDAYVRQYPSPEEQDRIREERFAQGQPCFIQKHPQKYHLDDPVVEGVCGTCIDKFVTDWSNANLPLMPCANCILFECQARGVKMDATTLLAASAVAAGDSELESEPLQLAGLCRGCIEARAPCEGCVTCALHPWRKAGSLIREQRPLLAQQYAKWCVPADPPASWPSEWWTHERLLEHHQRLVKALRAQDAAEHAGLLRIIDSGGKADEMRTRFDAFIGITPHDFLQCTDPYARGIALANLDYEEADQLLLIEQGLRVVHRSGCGCASQGFRDAGCRLLRARAPFRCIACTAWLAGAGERLVRAQVALEARRSERGSFCTAHGELRWECTRCFDELLVEMVQLRFEGDGERRQSWLNEREQERTAFEAFEAAESAARADEEAAARALKEKAFEREQRARELKREAQATLEKARLAAIKNAALAQGRPRIYDLNAHEWPPPDFSDVPGSLGVAVGAPQLWYWQMTGQRCVHRFIGSFPYSSDAAEQYAICVKRWAKLCKKGKPRLKVINEWARHWREQGYKDFESNRAWLQHSSWPPDHESLLASASPAFEADVHHSESDSDSADAADAGGERPRGGDGSKQSFESSDGIPLSTDGMQYGDGVLGIL